MINLPKIASSKLIFKNRLGSGLSLEALEQLVADSGFILIEYSRYDNNNDVKTLIHKLGLETSLAKTNSLIYSTSKIKLLFINKDLSETDKIILLRHELGHIYDTHLNMPNHLYSNIERELYANEFAHYLAYPPVWVRLCSLFFRNSSNSIIIALLLLIALSVCLLAML